MSRPMKSYKARGIVLHTVRYGDTSMVVYMLTDLWGRQTYMVQGVRSSRGRGNKAALFQPMFPVEFEGLESPRAEMHRLKELRSDYPLLSVPFDVRKSTIALFMAEVLYRLVRESGPDPALFGFVRSSVEALDVMDEGVSNFHLWFLAHLSRFLGFSPGNEYAEGDWFDIREGLYTGLQPVHGIAMNRDNSRIFALLSGCGPESLGSMALSRVSRVEFLNSLLVYYGYHLDAVQSVRSVDILRECFE